VSRVIHVLNGPNLNLLGQREPHIYGSTTLSEIETLCRESAQGDIRFAQTNHEGEMIEWIHAARDSASGIIINPAGWTFRSIAILDALKMFDGPIIELHISNIHARDPIYHDSLISPIATAIIAGLGAAGYPIAIKAMEGLVAA
jgi:3-dehydroquinate dehydratase-2